MSRILRRICPICGNVAKSPHHIIPRDKGGSDDFRNIVYLCYKCHDIVEMDGVILTPQIIEKYKFQIINGLEIGFNNDKLSIGSSEQLLPKVPIISYSSDSKLNEVKKYKDYILKIILDRGLSTKQVSFRTGLSKKSVSRARKFYRNNKIIGLTVIYKKGEV